MKWLLLLAAVGGAPPSRPPTQEEFLQGQVHVASTLAFIYMCLFIITLALLVWEKWKHRKLTNKPNG